MYRLELDRTMCISCGNCIEKCPEIFEFGSDGLSSIKGVEVSDLQILEVDENSCSADSARNCPVMCIHLYSNGEEIV